MLNTPQVEQTYRLTGSTLAELRDIVQATADLPGESKIRTRTRFSWSPEGGPIARLHIAGPPER